MTIEFATSDPIEAERYIRDSCPFYKDDLIDYVIQGVKDGIVRVRDPHMYGGNPDLVPMLGKDEAERWEEWCNPLIAMRNRDLPRAPKPVTLGAHVPIYGSRIGMERDEKGNVTDEGFIAWEGSESWDRKWAIKNALESDGKLYIAYKSQSVDVDETWIETDK